jgi:hypothetical protein
VVPIPGWDDIVTTIPRSGISFVTRTLVQFVEPLVDQTGTSCNNHSTFAAQHDRWHRVLQGHEGCTPICTVTISVDVDDGDDDVAP